jgi:sugar-specific transcriptional regulator TrmB
MADASHTHLEQKLLMLGFSEKEAKVYLALLEFGLQPASVIGRKTNIPRPTVLFLFERLLRIGYIRQAQRGKVRYFYADLEDLQKQKTADLEQTGKNLVHALTLLREFKNPFTTQPRVTFFEGVDGCRKAYALLLESETEILEFSAHEDLERMGKEFMKHFIKERARRKIFIYDVSKDSLLNRSFKKLDKKQQRHLKLYDPSLGNLFSSINVYEDKVLLLNLHQDAFAILIQSYAVSETLKTIHRLAFNSLNDERGI